MNDELNNKQSYIKDTTVYIFDNYGKEKDIAKCDNENFACRVSECLNAIKDIDNPNDLRETIFYLRDLSEYIDSLRCNYEDELSNYKEGNLDDFDDDFILEDDDLDRTKEVLYEDIIHNLKLLYTDARKILNKFSHIRDI